MEAERAEVVEGDTRAVAVVSDCKFVSEGVLTIEDRAGKSFRRIKGLPAVELDLLTGDDPPTDAATFDVVLATEVVRLTGDGAGAVVSTGTEAAFTGCRIWEAGVEVTLALFSAVVTGTEVFAVVGSDRTTVDLGKGKLYANLGSSTGGLAADEMPTTAPVVLYFGDSGSAMDVGVASSMLRSGFSMVVTETGAFRATDA